MTELENSINHTIVNADLSGLSVDYAEIIIDSFLKDGLAKDIPIVGTLISIGKLGKGVNEAIFIKKLINFLVNIKDIPASDRRKMIEQLENSETESRSVGETLLLIIHRMDNFEKPKVIGKIFGAFLKGHIRYDEFLRMSAAVDKIFLPDLKLLVNNDNYGGVLPYEIQNQLVYAGLMSMTRTGDLRISGGNEFYVNDLGIKIIEILK